MTRVRSETLPPPPIPVEKELVLREPIWPAKEQCMCRLGRVDCAVSEAEFVLSRGHPAFPVLCCGSAHSPSRMMVGGGRSVERAHVLSPAPRAWRAARDRATARRGARVDRRSYGQYHGVSRALRRGCRPAVLARPSPRGERHRGHPDVDLARDHRAIDRGRSHRRDAVRARRRALRGSRERAAQRDRSRVVRTDRSAADRDLVRLAIAIASMQSCSLVSSPRLRIACSRNDRAVA
jgi:hypothetical protein